MKCLKKVSAFLILIPTITFANWQVVSPHTVVPNQPIFPAGSPTPFNVYGSAGYPDKFANLGRPAAVYAISVCGSLKENIERIMDRYHWKVIWQAPYDYNFDGRVTGSSLPNVIQKLLKPFPLQARMYMSNRTMLVIQRNS